MKVVTLLENDTLDKKLGFAHGLSLYIEIRNKKILFDLGPNTLYRKNAKRLGIDLTEVDYLVISHGHYDHGTGIKQFLKLNKKALVYISKRAFADHVKSNGSNMSDIGIGRAPKSERIHYVNRENIMIGPSISICDNVNYHKQVIGDQNLMTYEDGKYIEDHFHHEIYLLISENDNNVLFTGCSHKGIKNILDTIEKNCDLLVTHIIGGLHFSHYDSLNFTQTDYLQKLGTKLSEEKNINVFACHCTGEDAFFELKQSMRNNLERLKTGSIIKI